MTPTPQAARMAEIVAASAPLLREAGFRKRRHGFNRRTESGLVHVVHFWMAPKEPPAWTEVPGLRPRLYGTFRIDFGVHVPEMTRMHTPRSDWINTFDCHLDRTIGQLQSGNDRHATWWPLDDPTAIDRAHDGLTMAGLPWLARFPDHESVFQAFRSGGPPAVAMSPAAGLDIADMLAAIGRTGEARMVLEDYVREPVLHTHVEVLVRYLEERGHVDLVPRIRARYN